MYITRIPHHTILLTITNYYQTHTRMFKCIYTTTPYTLHTFCTTLHTLHTITPPSHSTHMYSIYTAVKHYKHISHTTTYYTLRINHLQIPVHSESDCRFLWLWLPAFLCQQFQTLHTYSPALTDQRTFETHVLYLEEEHTCTYVCMYVYIYVLLAHLFTCSWLGLGK